jgi:hypothetical protein
MSIFSREDHGSVAQNRCGNFLTAPSVYPISPYPHYENRTITRTQAKIEQGERPFPDLVVLYG